MNEIFPIDNDLCKLFKEKDNPEFYITKLPRYLVSSISNLTLKFAKDAYFRDRLCLLHSKINHLFYFNYPNIEVVDENALLFLLKIYKLYELLGMKILDYNSERNSVIVFNNSINKDILYKYALILSLAEGKIKLDLTPGEREVIDSIKLAKELDFHNNLDNIFNAYLRFEIITPNFLKDFITKKIPVNKFEASIGKEFSKMKKNPNYLENKRSEFLQNYESLIQKLNNFYKSTEYKNFIKTLKIRKFKFPIKEHFGENKPITYQIFKKIIDEFITDVKIKLKK